MISAMFSWKSLIISLILAVLPTAVRGGHFGPKYTVPNREPSVAAGVGQGTAVLMKVNGTIKPVNIQTDHEVIVALTEATNMVIGPMEQFVENKLDPITDSEAMLSNFTSLSSIIRQSLDKAIASVNGLENKTHPMLYTEIVGNLTELADDIDRLKLAIFNVVSAFAQVENPEEDMTPEEFLSIFTPEMMMTLMGSNLKMHLSLAYLQHLDYIATAIIEEKKAIYYQILVNSSLSSQQQNNERIFSTALFAVSDANNTIVGLSTGFEKSVKHAYSSFVNQQQQGRQEILSTLTIHLDSIENSTKDFIQSINQSFTTLRHNINQALTDQSQIIMPMLHDGIENLTILTSSSSESEYADWCVKIYNYGAQWPLAPDAGRSLSECRGRGLNALVQTVRILLEQAKTDAISNSNWVRGCPYNSELCSYVLLFALSDLAQQTRARYMDAAADIQSQVKMLGQSFLVCALATKADTQKNKVKLFACLA